MSAAWIPDILGEPFEQRTLALEDDDQGPVEATLVRSIPSWFASIGRPLADVDVLYVHGWSDYFFQVDLAGFWTGLGARFHALDLRRYGRSLRDGQAPGYISSLDLYDADIEAALAAIGHGADAVPKRRLVLLGHSTGGLTLTLWAARHRGRASAIVLNSPWFELQVGAMARQTIEPLVGIRARLDPLGSHPLVLLYARAARAGHPAVGGGAGGVAARARIPVASGLARRDPRGPPAHRRGRGRRVPRARAAVHAHDAPVRLGARDDRERLGAGRRRHRAKRDAHRPARHDRAHRGSRP